MKLSKYSIPISICWYTYCVCQIFFLISSTFVSWHSSERKSFPFPLPFILIHVYVTMYSGILLSSGLFILMLRLSQFWLASASSSWLLCPVDMTYSFWAFSYFVVWENVLVLSQPQLWDHVNRNQDLDAEYAYCYWGVISSSLPRWTQLEVVCVRVHAYKYLSIPYVCSLFRQKPGSYPQYIYLFAQSYNTH